MARIKRNAIQKVCRFLLAGTRKGFLPSGMVFAITGFLAGRCENQIKGSGTAPEPEKEPPIELVMCYESIPIDKGPEGPRVTMAVVSPNPTEGARSVKVEASIRFVGNEALRRRIDGAYLRIDPPNITYRMNPADGVFDSDSEDAYLELNVSGWEEGEYQLTVFGYSEGIKRLPFDWAEYLTLNVTRKR